MSLFLIKFTNFVISLFPKFKDSKISGGLISNSAPKVLITAFEPFGGSDINPSQEVLKGLREPEGWSLEKLLLPVSHEKLETDLSRQLANSYPDLILSLGEARGANCFKIECQAQNLLEFSIPDNDGKTIRNTPIKKQGSPTLQATLCQSTIAQSFLNLKLAARISQDAGTYLCNQLLYTLCHRFMGSSTKVGFLHLPSLPEQNFGNGVALSRQIIAVQTILKALCLDKIRE